MIARLPLKPLQNIDWEKKKSIFTLSMKNTLRVYKENKKTGINE